MQRPTHRRRHALLRVALATSSVAALVAAFPSSSAGGGHAPIRLAHRGISTSAQSFNGKAFDYVIVGGGNAGLVLASRLSENSSITVAVIEAGPSGEGNTSLTTPSANLYNSAVGTDMDWAYQTTAQASMFNKQLPWPRGKTLGGSSAINGLYLVRQPAVEQDSWAKLVQGLSDDASATWGWDNVLDAMKKSETYTPVQSGADATIKAGDPGRKHSLVPYNQANHGENGPIHHSYPGTSYNDVGAFLQSITTVSGIKLNKDAYSGNNTGPFLSISAINPSNWTRSFARTGYLDPVADRSNLHVLTGYQATKIAFDTSGSKPRATGIEFAASANGPTYTVNASNEVILAAGVIGSPQLLQLSGVGDKSVLDPVKIKQVANVPGVGFNLQDHVSTAVTYSPQGNATLPPSKLTGDASVDSYVNGATAYIPLSGIVGANGTQSFVDAYRSNIASYVKAYDAPATVKAGFNATSYELSETLYPADVPAVEILLGNTYGNILVECGLQHPVSRGYVKVTSASAFDPPEIDPAYLLYEEDKKIMRDGCRFARSVGSSYPLSSYVNTELSPGANVQSDHDWDTFVANSSGTEYHPSSSCSMLPLELGGVVDQEFRVYNTQNLRVIDSSVPPLSMSQHLMTVTYGLAEIGAEMIQATQQGKNYTPIGYTASATGPSGSAGSASAAAGATSASPSGASGAASSKPDSDSPATRTRASVGMLLVAVVAMGAML